MTTTPTPPQWEDEVWQRLVGAGTPRKGEPNTLIVQLGTDDAGMALVVEGSCVIPSAAGGLLLTAGDTAGGTGWLLGRPVPADVVAVTTAHLAILGGGVLRSLEQTEPALMARAYRAMAAQWAERVWEAGAEDAG
jgi:hypothetical protein